MFWSRKTTTIVEDLGRNTQVYRKAREQTIDQLTRTLYHQICKVCINHSKVSEIPMVTIDLETMPIQDPIYASTTPEEKKKILATLQVLFANEGFTAVVETYASEKVHLRLQWPLPVELTPVGVVTTIAEGNGSEPTPSEADSN